MLLTECWWPAKRDLVCCNLILFVYGVVCVRGGGVAGCAAHKAVMVTGNWMLGVDS